MREALKRLEFYGILQTLPQSGTGVARLGVVALESLIANVLAFDPDDIAALLETRVVLEVETARLAAERATLRDLASIARANEAFRAKARTGDPALEEDLTFYLAIAAAARNAVLASLVGLIAPDTMRHHGAHQTCDRARVTEVIAGHDAVCAAIVAHDPETAALAMAAHARMARAQYQPKSRAAAQPKSRAAAQPKSGRTPRPGTSARS